MARIGANRKNAGARAIALVLYAIIVTTVGWMVMLLFAFVAVIDIVWQAITNGEGLMTRNPAEELWAWNKRLVGWMLWNKGTRPALREAKPTGHWRRG